MSKKERLNAAYAWLKYKGIVRTQEDVAERMGSSRGNVSSALSGKEGVMTDSFLTRFCNEFREISLSWLMLGIGDMLTSDAMSINERLRSILRTECTSPMELEKEHGEDFNKLQYYLEEAIVPPDKMLDSFCKLFRINKDWILKGEGDIKEKSKALVVTPEQKSEKETRPRLPMNVSSHNIDEYINGSMRSKCDERPLIEQFPDYDFTLVLKNDSMAPKYYRGDEIAVKRVDNSHYEKIEWGHDYLIDIDGDSPKFKVIYEKGTDILCRSHDPEKYPEFIVPKKNVCAIYRVVGMFRV